MAPQGPVCSEPGCMYLQQFKHTVHQNPQGDTWRDSKQKVVVEVATALGTMQQHFMQQYGMSRREATRQIISMMTELAEMDKAADQAAADLM